MLFSRTFRLRASVKFRKTKFAPVAQWIRAFDYGSKGRGFESLQAHHFRAIKHGDKMNHEFFMKEALKEALKAYKKNEVPVGAVVVKDGVVISRGHNLIRLTRNAAAHAEMIALKKASKKIGFVRLTGLALYVTLEPCPMCAGAILLSRLDSLIYGATDPKTGACGSVHTILNDKRNNHQVKITAGVLEKECAELLTGFFKEKRKQK